MELIWVSKENLQIKVRQKNKKRKKIMMIKKLKEDKHIPECYNWLNDFEQKKTNRRFSFTESNNFGKTNCKTENMIYRKWSFPCFL